MIPTEFMYLLSLPHASVESLSQIGTKLNLKNCTSCGKGIAMQQILLLYV